MADGGRRWWVALPVAGVGAALALGVFLVTGHGTTQPTAVVSARTGPAATPASTDSPAARTVVVFDEPFEQGVPSWTALERQGLAPGRPGHGGRAALKITDAGQALPAQLVTPDEPLPRGSGPRRVTATVWLRANTPMDATLSVSGLTGNDEVATGSSPSALPDTGWHQAKIVLIVPDATDHVRFRLTLPGLTGRRIVSVDDMKITISA